jgi:hypothetical protein
VVFTSNATPEANAKSVPTLPQHAHKLSGSGLSMLSKLNDPRYPIRNEFAPELGEVTFGSRRAILLIGDSGARNKTRDHARANKAKIDVFFSRIVGKPGLSFSPRQINGLIADVTAQKPQNLKDIMSMGFLVSVKNADQFCEKIRAPEFYDQLGKVVSMPESSGMDFRKIVQLIRIADASEMHPKRKEFLYRLSWSNVLTPFRSAADQHYYDNVPQLPVDTTKVGTSPASGINVERYGGGVHCNERDGEFWLKTSSVQSHVVIEAFSLLAAKYMGLQTTNPELVQVKQRNGGNVLAIKTDYVEDVLMVVPAELRSANQHQSETNKIFVRAAAQKAVQQFVSLSEENIRACALNIIHIILFNDKDAIGRNWGNLHARSNGELVVLDRGYSMIYRGLGDLKDIYLEKIFPKSFAGNPELSAPDENCPHSSAIQIFLHAIRTYLTQNKKSKEPVISYGKAALGKIHGRLNEIAKNTHLDSELKGHLIPIIKSRIDSLVNKLPEIFSDAR